MRPVTCFRAGSRNSVPLLRLTFATLETGKKLDALLKLRQGLARQGLKLFVMLPPPEMNAQGEDAVIAALCAPLRKLSPPLKPEAAGYLWPMYLRARQPVRIPGKVRLGRAVCPAQADAFPSMSMSERHGGRR